ncbi:penicillin-binding protein 2 [bacterium]|nr:penicillin-binding protein 2 [bacterium]
MSDRNELLREWSFYVVGSLIFLLLIYRLADLQIVRRTEYQSKSEENRIRFVEIPAPRGIIRDRNGALLVSNRPSYTCYGVPRDLWKDSIAVEKLGSALAGDPAEIRDKILRPNRTTYRPQRMRRDLPQTVLARFEEMRDQIPGTYLEIEPKRFHPDKLAPHAIGYVAEASEEEVEKYEGIEQGDLIGKRGLEKIYDTELRGKKGNRLSVVDVHGQEVEFGGSLGRIEAIPGKELWTTLDREAQILAESLLVDKIGAIVAMDTRTGGVVCFASSPSYDPDWFAGSISTDQWKYLMENSDKPMLNRVTQTMYPPGSTIKPAMLIEGLTSGVISPSWSVSCPGSFTYGNRTFKCWKKGGHGHIDCIQSLGQSCDVFYYKLGLQLGADGIYRALKRFHLGQPTGVDQTSEAAGIAPSKLYYDKRYGPNGWSTGFLVSVSIGQGEMLATPMQMCAFTAAIASDGVWKEPYLVEGIFDPSTRVLEKRAIPDSLPPSDAWPQAIEMAQLGMREVVWGAAGTARSQKNDSTRIAGKTGTAQNAHGDDHGWFIGYGPYDDPRYSVCCLVEFGKSGSGAAAPLAGAVLKNLIIRELYPEAVKKKEEEQEERADSLALPEVAAR